VVSAQVYARFFMTEGVPEGCQTSMLSFCGFRIFSFFSMLLSGGNKKVADPLVVDNSRTQEIVGLFRGNWKHVGS
jgi:hypothetical protein